MRRKNREEDRDGEQNQRKKKQKDEKTRTNGTLYLVLRPIPGGTLHGSKESTGFRSARLLTPPATLAQGRMQLTQTCKWGRKRPVIIWCE